MAARAHDRRTCVGNVHRLESEMDGSKIRFSVILYLKNRLLFLRGFNIIPHRIGMQGIRTMRIATSWVSSIDPLIPAGLLKLTFVTLPEYIADLAPHGTGLPGQEL
ncbi:Hypothetical predicted protein [Mytilus galloprovincialis]|uniref:Uncharacterized protein n=1 Tax=Mytilus galloprovincialis TaxID=29158 RepID=A0A8B6FRV6_MYTGA|nr:Hypothetical predicted protein [Mytilus galloprovincialis]